MEIYVSPDIEKHVNIEKFREYLEMSKNASWDRVLLFSVDFGGNKTPMCWPERWTPIIVVYAHAYPSGNAAYLVELLGIEDGDVYCWDEVARFSRPTDEESFECRGGNHELAKIFLPEALGSILFMIVIGDRRREYLEGDESKIYGTPQAFDQFYIDTSLYMYHPGSHSGGLVTITAVERVHDSYSVKVEEFVGVEFGIGRRGPNSWMGPKWLEEQESLKKRFGDQRAKSIAFNDFEISMQEIEEEKLKKLFSNGSE